ncbi:MAG: AAA family ATPase, partial [Cyanobacteria bacterium J06638_20]
TILFIDEVHRFNKAQQDALLPWVENGTVTLIGATTENPYFEVNKALVSRSRLFQLKPLEPPDLYRVAALVLEDRERGYGDRTITLEPEALDHLVNVANGDARALLNALELAIETTAVDDDGHLHITLGVAEDSIQQRAVLYDKEGDAHFDTISAFIKSVRGSDPDAALYWLARMIYAGEDPRFIFRRLVILASEDIGLGDPHAVTVVTSCAAAFDRVGLPEGRYPLAQATLYLATAPKSNSTMGFFDALAAVEREREGEVPSPLRDGNRDKEGFGHGQGYLYPHAYRDHWVAQQYLPNGLQGQVFYQPSDQGYEATIQTQVAQQREAQLAALVDGGGALPEVLTYSPNDPARDRWLQRTLSKTGEQLSHLRDHLFALAPPQRHHRILDLNARTGLLTWEALRRVPEGGVYARVHSVEDHTALTEQVAQLPELARPVLVHADFEALATYLPAHTPGIGFERIVGRNAFAQAANRDRFVDIIKPLLAPDGVVLLVETIPRYSQPISALLDPSDLSLALVKRWHRAEAAIANSTTDARFNWQAQTLGDLFNQAGFTVQLMEDTLDISVHISAALVQRWFAVDGTPPSYRDQLAHQLSDKDMTVIQQACQRQLQGQTVSWRSTVVYLMATLA